MVFKKGDKVLVEVLVSTDMNDGSEILVTSRRWNGIHQSWKVRSTDVIGVQNSLPLPESKWVPVEEWKGKEEKTVLVTLRLHKGGTRVSMVACEETSEGCFELMCPNEVVAVMDVPPPYEQPVKLRDSCEGCEHLEWWGRKVGDTPVCVKNKLVKPSPGTVNGKPCHEDVK